MESEIQVNKKRVTVVVLGDIGRSPRMQYHALSLAKCGLKVNIVGYLETPPIPLVLENADITITQLSPLAIQFAPKLVQYFLKAIWQFTSLVATLFLCGFSDYLLCQNPPAIPTLPACWIYCLIMRSKFIIDWHNYAYSIMALNLKQQHLLVKISKIIEQYFGSKAHRCLCVTLAMKNDLEYNWNIRAKVLYDRPPDIFRPISLEEKHNLFSRLSTQYKEFDFSTKNSLNLNSEGDASKSTAFTTMVDFKVRLRRDRPALLFSSTSWTADEDFSILLDALQVYESSCVTTSTLPRLICVITGKGPMKDHYVNLIAQRNWKHVKVITPWLEAIDYPKMVASADLGVCLHTSSSGLDLPMKVVDMFGAGLPVCAYRYPCLSELVKENVNGYTFADAPELSMHILKWFDQFPVNVDQNAIAENMKLELKKFQESRWDENWNKRAKEFFT